MNPHQPAHTALWPLRFISIEAMSGLVLLAGAALALILANSPWSQAYEALWRFRPGFGLGGFLAGRDLRFWVNDGLMSIFFLVVGLEIRRELHQGALSDSRVAMLPVVAATGGVVIPALLYLLANGDPATRRGWAIPTATDIAFAVGVLSLMGRCASPALRMLLLTLAIIDDIVAILVIAIYYSGGIATSGILVVAAGVVAVLLLQWLGARTALAYLLPGAVVWLGMLRAGLHPTLAGVLLGLMTPAAGEFGRRRALPLRPRAESLPPLVRLEAQLHPWVAFGIMPVFAMANSGVSLAGLESGAAPLAAGAGIVTGLVLGKPLGIVLASLAAVRLGLGSLPEGVRWPQVALLGLLGGVGFTMSIFIANLAFEDSRLLVAAKLAVFLASTLAAGIALVFGRLLSRSAARERQGGA